MIKVNKIGAYKRIKATGGKIFSAFFRKKDGSLRKMVCRTGVKAGVNGQGMSYTPEDYGYVPVFDMQNHGWRMINVNTLKQLVINGQTIKVR